MSIIGELKRRNVFRVGLAYVLLGWVVLQAADFALDLIDAPNWIIQAMFIIGLAGLPIALFFSWAFEITPEGIRRESDVDPARSITPQTARKLDRAIILFLALAVVLLLGDRYFSDRGSVEPSVTEVSEPAENAEPDTEAPEKSIAVLPFINMSSDPEQEFFSDGITEEILNALAKVQALRVAGRTSSFAFKGRNEDLRAIGETLGVDHLLEGSVRKAGDRIRITAQLVQVKDGFHLWSESYDRQMTDIFEVQDDIANQILAAMKTEFEVQPTAKRELLDNDAYEKYLMARQLVRQREREPAQRALALLEEINEREPDFAPAWTLRAQALEISEDYGEDRGFLSPEEVFKQGRSFLERAEALDPENPEMLAGWGLLYRRIGNMERSVEYLERALAINPALIDANNWLWYWRLLAGRFQEAYAINQRIRAIDPFYLPTSGNIDYDFMALGLDHAFSEHVDQITKQLSDVDIRYPLQGQILLAITKADYAKALQLWNPELNRWPFHQDWIAEILMRLGEPDWAAQVVTGRPYEMVVLGSAGRLDEANLVTEGLALEAPVEYTRALVASGRHADAVAVFDEHIVSFEAAFGDTRNFWDDGAVFVGRWAEAMRETGDKRRFEQFLALHGQLLDHMTAEGVASPGYRFSRAYHSTLMGDSEDALRHLSEIVASGHFLPPEFIDQWRTFEPLIGNAEFEALRAQMAVLRNQQRAQLDLPPYEERPSG